MAFKLSPGTLIVLAAVAIVVLPGLVLPSAYYFRVGALVL